MQNTSEILPDNCPVRISSGSFKNRTGRTCSLPDDAGRQWVEVKPTGREKAPQKQFTRAQLVDLRPVPAPVPATLSAAA